MKTVYLHTHQTCMVTFVKCAKVKDPEDEDVLDSIAESGAATLLGVVIGDGVSDAADEWFPDNPLPHMTYKEPVHHTRDIVQYDENVFVWLDETGNVGGAASSFEQAQHGLQTYAISMGHPNLRVILDISTAHVSEVTSWYLNEWGDLHSPPGAAIVHPKGEYGWLVYVPSEMPPREDRYLIPDDLWNVMVYANNRGCDWIMFDRDGTTVEELPVYDW